MRVQVEVAAPECRCPPQRRLAMWQGAPGRRTSGHGAVGAAVAGDFTAPARPHHLDLRPCELATTRLSRSPEAIDGYRAELPRTGWPLCDCEEAAVKPVYHAFRVDMPDAPATFISVDVSEIVGHAGDCRRKRTGLPSSGIEVLSKGSCQGQPG